MATRVPFEIDEWYHCYNRGVDKRVVFTDSQEYNRFLLCLLLGNQEMPVHISNTGFKNYQEALLATSEMKVSPLVEIGAYCLMPNHFHIIAREIVRGGMGRFMQKVSTGYTMYFNAKHERTGSLFAGTFKSKHLRGDRYLKHAVSYVHLNPAELYEPRWKEGEADLHHVRTQLEKYSYSSLSDFLSRDEERPKILSNSIFDYYDEIPSLDQITEEALLYYSESNIKV